MKSGNLFTALSIVTGAGGTLGKEFVARFAADPSTCVVACSRRHAAISTPNIYHCLSHENHFSTRDRHCVPNPITFPIEENWFSATRPIAVSLVYVIGPFAFDAETPNPQRLRRSQINPQIYGPIVNGLRNYLTATCNLLRQWNLESDLHLVCFDSISTASNPLFWQSYALSKRTMRRYLRQISKKRFSSLIVNTSTIDTCGENKIRPGATVAEKSGWLQSGQVVDAVMAELQKPAAKGIRELTLYIPQPNPPDYSSLACFKRWQRQRCSANFNA